MREHLLVTAVGEDRPGIVARLAEVFAGHGANLEESRMSILGGEFAAIALITLPAQNIDALLRDLEKLKNEAITVSTKATKPLSTDRFDGYVSYEINLRGADHEGIVHHVASYLKESGINIESMDTSVKPAPETGTPLFNLKAYITVPPSHEFEKLNAKLLEIGRAESVDIELKPTSGKAARVALGR